MNEETIKEIIGLYNTFVNDANRSLEQMSQAEEAAISAHKDGNVKAERKATERYNNHSDKHSFCLGQQDGIEDMLSIIGYDLCVDDDGMATAIRKAQ